MADNNELISDPADPVPLKEDEELMAAVQEVKDAAINVTTSSAQLTSAIVNRVPGIFWRLFTAFVDKEIR